LLTEGIAGNTLALRLWSQCAVPEEQIDLTTLHEGMEEAGYRAHRNELVDAERMLMAQAITLNAMFTALAARSHHNTMLEQFQINMRLALRVQSNCRATLETLAAMKNPPAVFARQANIAQGGQVVNNGTIEASARAGISTSAPTELLEAGTYGERLDRDTQGDAAGGDPTLAPLDTLDGSAHGRGQGPRVPQPVPRRRAAETPRVGTRARGAPRAVRAGTGRSGLTGKG
jgi:hypothetical protein